MLAVGLHCPLMDHVHCGRPWPLSWEKGPPCLWQLTSTAAGPIAQFLRLRLVGAVGLFSLLSWVSLNLCFWGGGKVHLFEYVNRQSTFNAEERIILPLVMAYTEGWRAAFPFTTAILYLWAVMCIVGCTGELAAGTTVKLTKSSLLFGRTWRRD